MSRPSSAIFCNPVGANHRPPSHLSKASRAPRRSTPNGASDSGGIIASACSGLFSRCVPQYGHFSVTTLSSRSTVAPHPAQQTCDDRPATVEPPPSAFRRYSWKSCSTIAPPASSESGIVVVWPQYGHLRLRERGSNSTLAPQLAQGNSRPAGGALESVGSRVTGGAFGIGGGASGMARGLFEEEPLPRPLP